MQEVNAPILLGEVLSEFALLFFCSKKSVIQKKCNKCNIFFKSPMHRNNDANSKLISSHYGAILYGGK